MKQLRITSIIPHSRRQRWLPRSGEEGSPCPRQGPYFFLGGWEAFSSSSHLMFLCSLTALPSSLAQNTLGARGRERKGEEGERGLQSPTSIVFCCPSAGLSKRSSLALLFPGPGTPKPPRPPDHCNQNKRTDHSTVAAAAPTVAAAARVAARAGPGPDADAPHPGGWGALGSLRGARGSGEPLRQPPGMGEAALRARTPRLCPLLTFKIRSV